MANRILSRSVGSQRPAALDSEDDPTVVLPTLVNVGGEPARVVKDTMSDRSTVFNVEVRGDCGVITIGCTDVDAATALADLINQQAWVN